MKDQNQIHADQIADSAVCEVETLLGYSFLNPKLLEEALTHSSFSDGSCSSYERLEFLGDAALSLAISRYLHLTYPSRGPGPLTILRSANVSTETFARVAVRHMLYSFVRRKCPTLDSQVEQFTISVMEEPEESRIHGGFTMKAPKVLADIVESIAGAVFIDSNFNLEITWKVMSGILEPIITEKTLNEQPITSLYNVCQRNGKVPVFQVQEKENITTVSIFLDEELIGNSSSEKKAVARLNAARDALQNLFGDKLNVLNRSSMKSGDEKEAKQKLINFCSKNGWSRPVYKLENVEGPENGKRFMCSVHIEKPNAALTSLGEFKSRVKDAESSAASNLTSEILKET
ncbi:hypothetical protein LUZ60_009960 [Juncus effusus]|nr:hypothetical protein LUZ60_009960 [Juncus effusus]